MDTEALINLISNKPAIWMVTHPQHKYRTVTNAIWEEIKQEFPDTEVNSLRKKWKYLRCTYRRQLKRTNPNWKYFEMMAFLKDQYETEESDPLNIDTNNSESPEMVEASSPVIMSGSASQPASPTFSAPNRDNSLQQSDTLRTYRKQTNSDNQTAVPNKKKKFELMEKEFYSEDSTKSDDYCFLMSLLPHIIKLPPIQKLRLRNKFHQIVLDEMTACYRKS